MVELIGNCAYKFYYSIFGLFFGGHLLLTIVLAFLLICMQMGAITFCHSCRCVKGQTIRHLRWKAVIVQASNRFHTCTQKRSHDDLICHSCGSYFILPPMRKCIILINDSKMNSIMFCSQLRSGSTKSLPQVSHVTYVSLVLEKHGSYSWNLLRLVIYQNSFHSCSNFGYWCVSLQILALLTLVPVRLSRLNCASAYCGWDSSPGTICKAPRRM